MAFTDIQVRQLKAKLDPRNTSRRATPTALNFSYVEGWHVIAEANRIFGFDAWDRRTLSSNCVWSGAERSDSMQPPTPPKCGSACAPATSKIVREGSGTGEGKSPYPGASA